MKYLLDVNALLALVLIEHEFHDRVARWASKQPLGSFATCSITELGFVRVLAKAPAYGFTVPQAVSLLERMKKAAAMQLIADTHDVGRLPAWVKTANQTTDGHLLELARANSLTLATLDTKIPGAYIIP